MAVLVLVPTELAYAVMAYNFLACVVMAYIVMAILVRSHRTSLFSAVSARASRARPEKGIALATAAANNRWAMTIQAIPK